jgi:thioesterase domain-containing protein
MGREFAFGSIGLACEYWDEPYPNGSAERGARVEIRRMEDGRLGSPVWRGDLFGIAGGAPGNHDRAHYHARFVGWTTGKRRWARRLTNDPVGWVMERIADMPGLLAEAGAPELVAGTELDEVQRMLPEIRSAISSQMETLPFSGPHVETIQPGGHETPVFFLTHAEAAITMLPELRLTLGGERPLYGLGVGTWAEHLAQMDSVEAVAWEALRQIRSVRRDGPVILAGHSFGGLVAFETARLMAKEEKAPELLVLVDPVPAGTLPLATRARMGWHWLRPRVLKHVPALIRSFLRIARDMATGKPPRPKPSPSTAVDEPEVPRGERPPGSSAFPKVGLLRDLTRKYRPSSYDGNVVLFRTERSLDHYRDQSLGWGRSVRGRLELEDLPGTHGGAVRPPAIEVLGEKLAARLGRTT